MNFDTEEIMALLAEYIEKHPLAVECGGEYIMQDDEAQVDALNLVCNIFDNMQRQKARNYGNIQHYGNDESEQFHFRGKGSSANNE